MRIEPFARLDRARRRELDSETELMGLEPGKTPKDVDAWFEAGGSGPAPVTFPGGMQSIPPGTSVFEELRLEAGTTYYLLEDEHGLRATFTPQR